MKRWDDIPGTFTCPQFYDWLAKEYPNGHIVEVGVDHGQSAAYLAALLEGSDARIDLVDVDLGKVGRNLDGYRSIGTRLQYHSVKAAEYFSTGELDAVFIDADHSYESVLSDIDAWYPKVRSGGVLSGHDYTEEFFPGLVKAVRERFDGTRITVNVVKGSGWEKCDKGCFDGKWHGHLVEKGGIYCPAWWIRKP